LAYDKEGGRGHGGWRPLIEKNGKAVIWGIDLPLEGRRMGGNSTSLSSFEAKALLSFEIFKAVHEWRDRLARQYDESWRYILSNKTLAGIADLAPKDTQQLMQVLGHDHKGILRDHFQELDSLLDTTRKNVEKMISNANASAQKPGSPTQSQAALSPSTCAPFSLPASSASTSNSILFGVPQKRSSPSRRSPKPSKSLLPFLFPQNGLDKVKSNFEQIAEKVHASFGQLDAFKPVEKQASRSPTPSRSPSPVGDVEMNGTESGPHTFAANGDHIFLSKKDRILANAAKSAKVEEPEEDADIVQVGKHKKNKKRKQGDAPAPASSASKVKLEVEPFDYSTVKSVLDMKPEGGASAGPSRKKQKKDKDGVNDNKKKQTGLDYDFKSAPKSMNQPKSGNRSQTFTK
jgi:exosome complex exonuclease RRP6